MIKEAYCSYDIAKLLKEKGFDECIFEFYEGDRIKYARNDEGFRLSELPDTYYPHITHQMACAWLREVKSINIFILPLRKGYTYSLYNNTGALTLKELREYSTYENATEEAIKYVLENLL